MTGTLEGVILRTNKKLKLTAGQREAKLRKNRAQDERLKRRIKTLEDKKQKIESQLTVARRESYALANQRRDITSYISPLVTAEAFVEYLMNYKGLDKDTIHDEILALPKEAIIRKGIKIINITPKKGL